MSLGPTAIRTDIVTRLTGTTSAGAEVYDSPILDWPDTRSWPVIGVSSRQSTGTLASMSGASFSRVDLLEIEATTEAATDALLAAALDTIEDQVLTVLLADDEWYNQFSQVSFTVDRLASIASTKRRGSVKIDLTLTQQNIEYETAEPDATNSFERLEVETDLAQVDGEIDVTQTITLTGDPS